MTTSNNQKQNPKIKKLTPTTIINGVNGSIANDTIDAIGTIYKVGGAIRDKLLGQPVHDYDYVVVAGSIEKMIQHNFIPVGKHFPVFLHPVTREEYALARTEKKIAIGYHGFSFNTAPNVTLKEDLARRDLTMNAIAEDKYGNLIDPFGGIKDLKLGIIRHVSPAFSEDPLRIIRVARFIAKFNFTIALETILLIKTIVANKELTSISEERIYNELIKALATPRPIRFFKTLFEFGALLQVLPNLDIAFKYNPTNMLLLDKILTLAKITHCNMDEQLALLFYFMILNNKGLPINCKLYKEEQKLALLLIQFSNPILNLNTLTPSEILDLLQHLDPIRRHKRYFTLLKLIPIIYKAHNTKHNINSLSLNNFRVLGNIIKNIQQYDFKKQLANTAPSNIANLVAQIKLKIIKSCRQNNSNPSF